MKYSDNGRKVVRKLGQRRKTFSINDNLGSYSRYDLQGKKVVFIGDQEETYYLTKEKEYEILDIGEDKFITDEKLKERYSDLSYHKRRKLLDYFHHHGATITIINDKGHKRKYYHEMFRLVEKCPECGFKIRRYKNGLLKGRHKFGCSKGSYNKENNKE